MKVDHSHIREQLQSEILKLQGFKPASHHRVDYGMEALKECFPNSTFPLGAVHEFLSETAEGLAATTGFILALLKIMLNGGACLWVSPTKTIFPTALKNYGVDPDHCIFIHTKNKNDLLWSIEEGLKCAALSAVVGEVSELTFTESRRLQLAVESSQVTGFIVRHGAKKINTTACVSRWKINSIPSHSIDDLPGIGFPQWKVELLRMKNGRTGMWELQLINGNLVDSGRSQIELQYHQKAV